MIFYMSIKPPSHVDEEMYISAPTLSSIVGPLHAPPRDCLQTIGLFVNRHTRTQAHRHTQGRRVLAKNPCCRVAYSQSVIRIVSRQELKKGFFSVCLSTLERIFCLSTLLLPQGSVFFNSLLFLILAIEIFVLLCIISFFDSYYNTFTSRNRIFICF